MIFHMIEGDINTVNYTFNLLSSYINSLDYLNRASWLTRASNVEKYPEYILVN